MKHFELKTFSDDRDLARSVAALWLERVLETSKQGTPFSVALSGGRITRQFFIEIATQAIDRAVALANVHFFWADERCVPPTDPESNFALANQNFFQPLKISRSSIHRLHGELEPSEAVAKANAEIKSVALLNEQGQPKLDMVLLGIGDDGHVASLFPNASPETQQNQEPFLFITNSPKPPPTRISLSYAAIAASQEVWVLASGAGKELVLAESISKAGQTPLARVLQSRQNTKIFTDLKLE